MSITTLSVAQTKKMLNNLEAWLDKAIAYAKAKSFDPEVYVSSRLAPDQYALARQIQSACDTAKFLAARLSAKEPPKNPDTETTLEQLRARIHTTVSYLDSFKDSDFAGAEERAIALPNRDGKLLKGIDYLLQHALPNFYFHVTTAYAILRHNGVDVGKRDYIGVLPLYDR